MATILFALDDGPYGSERPYNALRHAPAVSRLDDTQVRVFLTADATACAVAGQAPLEGFYSIERIPERSAREESVGRHMRVVPGRPGLGVREIGGRLRAGLHGRARAVDGRSGQGADLLAGIRPPARRRRPRTAKGA